jgi:activating signal cointegrator 1
MASLFCWGALMVPHLVLDQSDKTITVQAEDKPQVIPFTRIKSWAKEGDRVRVLMGYNWHIGTVLGGEILRVDLDKLGIVRIWKAGVLKPLYVPPTAQVGVLEIPDIEPNNEAITIIGSTSKSIISGSSEIANGTVKIISLWQPWASLIAYELKQYETRSWSTPYRGTLVIHAAKRAMTIEDKEVWNSAVWVACDNKYVEGKFPNVEDLPLGAIVAIADLTHGGLFMGNSNGDHGIDIGSITQLEYMCGNWAPRRYAWRLENVKRVASFPYKGGQSIRDLPTDVFLQLQTGLYL